MNTTIERATRTRTPRWQPVWRMFGTLATLAALLAGSLAVLGLLLQSSETTEQMYQRPFSGLTLDVDNADIEIEPGSADRIRVTRVTEWTAIRPRIEEELAGETLRIRTRCAVDLGKPCRVSYRLRVPPQIPLTVKAVGGDVTARALTGPVTIDMIGGDVLTDGLTGDVTAESRAGDMRILQSRSESVRVIGHAGDSYLHFTDPPKTADVRMTAGDLDIRVPSGHPYAVDAESVAGNRDVAVDNDLAAPYRIRARVSSGSLSVRYGTGAAPAAPEVPRSP